MELCSKNDSWKTSAPGGVLTLSVSQLSDNQDLRHDITNVEPPSLTLKIAFSMFFYLLFNLPSKFGIVDCGY